MEENSTVLLYEEKRYVNSRVLGLHTERMESSSQTCAMDLGLRGWDTWRQLMRAMAVILHVEQREGSSIMPDRKGWLNKGDNRCDKAEEF